MLLGTLIISLISIGLIINYIFEIKCSCKVRGMQPKNQDTNDSESSEEIDTHNQNSSDSDELEQMPIKNSYDCCVQDKSSDNYKSNKPLLECSRACSCHDLNNNTSDDTDDDMPPLIPVSDTESYNQVKIDNLREQIIN